MKTILASAAFAVTLGAGMPASAASYAPNVHRATTILNNAYGGSFEMKADGYTNGSLTATRIDLPVLEAGDYQVRALARYASYKQSFGVRASSTDPVEGIMEVQGFGTDVTGDGSFSLQDSAELIRFDPLGKSLTYSSLDTENPYGDTHMLAFELTGVGIHEPTRLVFFESMLRGDEDFDDLVAEIRGGGFASSAPSPAAGLGGIALLGMLFGKRLFDGRKRRAAAVYS